MMSNARKLSLAGVSAVIIVIAVISLLHPVRLARFLPIYVNRAKSGTLTPSSNTPTTLPGVNAAAFKGQGRLAFVWQGMLYVLDGGTGEVYQVTNSGVASQPVWSHDGGWLAFMKATGPQEMPAVWLARLDGTQAHQVRESALGSQFSWSPTDDVLVVYGQSGVWLVPVNGEPIHLPDGGLNWSPDGKSLAYCTTMFKSPQDRSDTLFTVAIDGGKPEKQIAAPFLNGIIIVGWWPDGKGLLYSLDPSYSNSIMADGLNLWSPRLGEKKPRMLPCGLHYQDWLSMSPHGDLLMVAGSGREVWANKNLTVVNVESGSMLNLKNPVGSVSIDPSLSPDGRRLCSDHQLR